MARQAPNAGPYADYIKRNALRSQADRERRTVEAVDQERREMGTYTRKGDIELPDEREIEYRHLTPLPTLPSVKKRTPMKPRSQAKGR